MTHGFETNLALVIGFVREFVFFFFPFEFLDYKIGGCGLKGCRSTKGSSVFILLWKYFGDLVSFSYSGIWVRFAYCFILVFTPFYSPFLVLASTFILVLSLIFTLGGRSLCIWGLSVLDSSGLSINEDW